MFLPRLDYIYLIGPWNGLHKIGITKHLANRLAALRCKAGRQLEIVDAALVTDGRDTEWALHSHFREQRVHGEWFDLDESGRAEFSELLGLYRKCADILLARHKGPS